MTRSTDGGDRKGKCQELSRVLFYYYFFFSPPSSLFLRTRAGDLPLGRIMAQWKKNKRFEIRIPELTFREKAAFPWQFHLFAILVSTNCHYSSCTICNGTIIIRRLEEIIIPLLPFERHLSKTEKERSDLKDFFLLLLSMKVKSPSFVQMGKRKRVAWLLGWFMQAKEKEFVGKGFFAFFLSFLWVDDISSTRADEQKRSTTKKTQKKKVRSKGQNAFCLFFSLSLSRHSSVSPGCVRKKKSRVVLTMPCPTQTKKDTDGPFP